MNAYYEELPLSQLVVHPKNVRKDIGIVVDLANSIAAKGLLQPLVVAPAPSSKPIGFETHEIDGPRYIIIGGHRRHAAAQLAGLDALPCVIRRDLDTEAAQLEAMLVENTQRTDLTVTEEAEAYQALLEFPGYTIKSIAKGVGRSQKLVRDRVQLTKLPDAAKARLEDHTLTIDRALELATFSDDEAATARLLGHVASTQSNWDYYLKEEEARKAWQASLQGVRAELEAAGITLVDRPEGHTYSWTDWRTVYTVMDVKDHAAADHSAVVDAADTSIIWVVPRTVTQTAMPEPTEEDRAEAEKVGRLTAGLGLAAHVRAAFLQSVVKTPPTDKPHEALLRLVLDADNLYQDFADLLGLGEDVDETMVAEEVQKLTTDQLIMLLFIGNREKERHMTALSSWNPEVTGWSSTNEWRDDLTQVLGYQLNDIETEAIAYHQAKNEPRSTNHGSDDGD